MVGTVVGIVVGSEKVREKPGGHCGVHMWTLNKYGKNHMGTVVYTVGTEKILEKLVGTVVYICGARRLLCLA